MNASRTGRATTAVLISILALAALLRFLSLGSGLPHVVGVDEGFEVHRALRLGAGEIDLERDAKGGFFYLLFVGYGLYFVWLLVTGKVASPTEFAQAFTADLTPFWMIGRALHALLGLLTVYWVYRLGRRMYGERTGLLGAAIVGVSLLHVARSHYIGVDVPMVLLVVVVLELAHRWSDPREPERPWLLGAVFGFAVMTKIVAVAMVLPIALANWLRWRDRPLLERLASRRLLTAYAVGAVVFVIGNPGFLFNLGNFFGEAFAALFGVGVEADSPGGSPAAAPNLWLYYLEVLNGDLGFALLALALAGVALALARRRPADLLLLATVAVFYLLLAGARTSHLFYPRYALPLLPPLALLAARLLDRVVERLPVRPGARGPILAITAALMLVPLAVDAWSWVAREGRPDSRVVAREWFELHAEPGSTVFLIGNPLIDTAPNLSLPLRNTDDNLDALIESTRASEPSKARVLEWRKASAPGTAFDLRTVRHYEPNHSLEHYIEEDVDYLVIDEHHFDQDRLRRDRKHSTEVLESRAALAEACRTDARAELAWTIDPASEGISGPAIEVFRIRERKIAIDVVTGVTR